MRIKMPCPRAELPWQADLNQGHAGQESMDSGE